MKLFMVAGIAGLLLSGCSVAGWAYTPLQGQTYAQLQQDYIACEGAGQKTCMEARGYRADHQTVGVEGDDAGNIFDAIGALLDSIPR